MSRTGVRCTLIAIIASYVTFIGMVVATEVFLSRRAPSVAIGRAYFGSDLVIQCFYTVVAGYMCCAIGRSQRAALAGLTGIGLVVGAVSLVTSWKSEPHWYGIGLYISYAPCLWVGWTLRDRLNDWSLRRQPGERDRA